MDVVPDYAEYLCDGQNSGDGIPRIFPISSVEIFRGGEEHSIKVSTFQKLYYSAFGHRIGGILPAQHEFGLSDEERLYLEACCIHRIASIAPLSNESVSLGRISAITKKVDDLWLSGFGEVHRKQPNPVLYTPPQTIRTRAYNKIFGVNVTPTDLNRNGHHFPSVYEIEFVSDVSVSLIEGAVNLAPNCTSSQIFYIDGIALETYLQGEISDKVVLITNRRISVNGSEIVVPKIEEVMYRTSSHLIDDENAISMGRRIIGRIISCQRTANSIVSAKRKYRSSRR